MAYLTDLLKDVITTDSAGNPALRVSYDGVSTSAGGSGSVSVLDNVTSPQIAIQLLGGILDKDLLSGGATFYAISGHYYLYRINTSGTITWEITDGSASGDTSPTANTESVYDLHAKAKINAYEKAALDALSTHYSWSSYTAVTALSTYWYNVATWLTDAGERSELFSVIAKYKSGYQPAIATEVVNRGGNLAIQDNITEGYYLNAAGAQADSTYMYVNDYIPVMPSTQYASDGITHVVGYDASKGSTANVTLASGVFTTGANQHYIRISFLIADRDTIQLNQGSTANDYSAPLNAPAIFGSRSENQLINGNGELGVYGWDDYDTTLSWDAVESAFKIVRSGAVTARIFSQDQPINKPLTVYANAKDDGTTVGYIYIFTYSGGALADLDATPSGWTKSTTGSYRIALTSSYVGSSMFLDENMGVDSFRISLQALTLDGDAWVKEMQVINGEYTTSEIEAKGYVSYDPIVLHTCQSDDESTTVADRAFQQGADFFLEHNVTTYSYVYGDSLLGSDLTSGTLTVGKRYLISDYISGDDFTNVGAASNADGVSFVATGTTPTTWTNSSVLNAYNVKESTAPTLENITEFVAGSLKQPTNVGQNHIVAEGGVLLDFDYSTGLGALIESMADQMMSKANKTDVPKQYVLSVTSTAGVGASSDTIVLFSDVSNFPDYIANAEIVDEYLDTNIDSVTVFDNAIVITADATGTGAGDELCRLVIAEAQPEVKHTVA